MIDAESGAVLLPRLEVTQTRFEAGWGLLGRAGLAADTGMLIRGCGSIHTCFMRFALDVAFLDAGGAVRRLWPGVRPWRLAWAWGACDTLELAAGGGQRLGLRKGMHLAVAYDEK